MINRTRNNGTIGMWFRGKNTHLEDYFPAVIMREGFFWMIVPSTTVMAHDEPALICVKAYYREPKLMVRNVVGFWNEYISCRMNDTNMLTVYETEKLAKDDLLRAKLEGIPVHLVTSLL